MGVSRGTGEPRPVETGRQGDKTEGQTDTHKERQPRRGRQQKRLGGGGAGRRIGFIHACMRNTRTTVDSTTQERRGGVIYAYRMYVQRAAWKTPTKTKRRGACLGLLGVIRESFRA